MRTRARALAEDGTARDAEPTRIARVRNHARCYEYNTRWAKENHALLEDALIFAVGRKCPACFDIRKMQNTSEQA